MQTSGKINSFLEEARDKAAALHKSIEAANAQGEARMQASLKDAGAQADALAVELEKQSATADETIKSKLASATAHAKEVVQHGQSNRPRPMLDAAQKLNHDLSDALAHVRGNRGK